MSISIKSDEEVSKIREISKIVGETLNLLGKEIKPGVKTIYLDKIAEQYARSKGANPSCKGYCGYPATICSSINEQVIHGIPGNTVLKEGDIISIDLVLDKDGYHGDATRTFAVGKISDEKQRLIDVTRDSFFEGIKFAKKGFHVYQISSAIQKYVESHGYSVIREYVGHGIGKEMHEAPQIPNYKPVGRGPKLYKGMTLAVEPMVATGRYDVKVLKDNWTVITSDRSCAAHYENTILVTDDEPEILTLI